MAAFVLAAPIAAQARPPMAALHASAPSRALVIGQTPAAQPAVISGPVSRHVGLLHLRRNHTVTSFAISDSRGVRPG